MTDRLAVRLAIGAVASVAACIVLLQVVDMPATLGRLGSLEPAWLIVPLIALAVQFGLRTWRWRLLLSAAAATRVGLGRVAGPLAVGYLANVVLPARLGEMVRAVIVARRERLAIGSVAASVVVERAFDIVALLVLGILTTGIGSVGWLSGAAVTGLLAGLWALARFAPAINRNVPRHLPRRLRGATAHFLSGVGGIGLRTATAGLAASALAWTGDIAVVWSCARAIGVDLSLAAATAIAVGAVLGTAVPAAGGYVGTYELGAVAFGSLAGTSSDTILAVALLSHVFAVIPMGLVGIAAMLRMGVRLDLRSASGTTWASADGGAGRP